MPLIPADNDVGVMAALFAIAAFGFLAEKTRWGAALTGAVWAILGAILASNLNIIPKSAPAYDFVFAYFVPALIPLFLLKANLRAILFETTRTTGAFAIASLGTVLGALAAAALLPLGPREPEIAGLFTATYIGGSVNYAALAEITGLRESDPALIPAATATDNLASAIFLAFLAMAPGWRWLASRFPARDHSGEGAEAGEEGRPTALTLAVSAALALVIFAAGDGIAAALGLEQYRLLFITALALVPATAFPERMARLHGGYEIGVALAFVFFAAIAAGADVAAMMATAPILIALVAVLLSVHAAVTFGLGRVFGLSLPELITASNAAILGATTAPALAAAKGWRDLVTPGVLVGVFGYAVGSFAGVGVFEGWAALTR
ncbi:MAG: DUF819 family protein [Caulobacterales bacterium]|nr:DUF819 family protein [Caulobacterales bacterium]